MAIDDIWLVSWDDYSQYMEEKNMFQTTNQITIWIVRDYLVTIL